VNARMGSECLLLARLFSLGASSSIAGDKRDPAGIYFGTNCGSVLASFDEGENWQEIARHLPTILAALDLSA
jgi:hypothetical protein